MPLLVENSHAPRHMWCSTGDWLSLWKARKMQRPLHSQNLHLVDPNISRQRFRHWPLVLLLLSSAMRFPITDLLSVLSAISDRDWFLGGWMLEPLSRITRIK